MKRKPQLNVRKAALYSIVINALQIAAVVARRTGIPLDRLQQSEQTRLLSFFFSRIFLRRAVISCFLSSFSFMVWRLSYIFFPFDNTIYTLALPFLSISCRTAPAMASPE